MSVYDLIEETLISDKSLGRKIKCAHEKHLENVKKNKPLWEEEGRKLRDKRELHEISRLELSEWIGICEQTIAKLESGRYVRSRKILVGSYKMAIELITNGRKLFFENSEKVKSKRKNKKMKRLKKIKK